MADQPEQNKRPARRWALAMGIAVLIAGATLLPIHVQSQAPAGLPLDKLVHLVAFAALTGALVWARPHGTPLWLLMALALAYGGAIEVIQPYVGRNGEWGDLAADALGVLAGAGAGAWLVSLWRGRAMRR